MKFGYTRGYTDGYAAAKENYDQLLASLYAQLDSARACEAAANVRADGAVDLLVTKTLNAQPISAGAKNERAQAAAALQSRHGIIEPAHEVDPFEDLPFGDKRGRFKTADEAMLNGRELN